jgi:cation transport ATPase
MSDVTVDAAAAEVEEKEAEETCATVEAVNGLDERAVASMVAMIFSNILPGVEASALQIALATTVTTAVSTLLSEWLAKREVSWRSTGVQFAFMVAANFAIVIVFYVLLGSDESSLRLGNTLFFVTLLTLILVLFDRYRDVGLHHQRSRRTGLPA